MVQTEDIEMVVSAGKEVDERWWVGSDFAEQDRLENLIEHMDQHQFRGY
jgi:hypothetical protein